MSIIQNQYFFYGTALKQIKSAIRFKRNRQEAQELEKIFSLTYMYYFMHFVC